MGFSAGASGKEPAYQCRSLIPGSGRFPWRRAWQPTPVFLPGEFHGQRSLVGQSLGWQRVRHVKKAEHRRIDAFELWCWRSLLRVPWTARRSNQSILKEISPGCSLEGLMLKLKLQYFGHLMRRVDSLEKTDDGRDWGQEEKGTTEDEMAGWRHRLDGYEFEWTPGAGDGQGGLACWDSWVAKSRIQLSNWTELNWIECFP